MRRRISICVIILSIAIVTVTAVSFRVHRKPAERPAKESEALQEATEEPAMPASTAPASYAYILGIREGYLVVYLPDRQTIYMETGIRADTLPADISANLAAGVGVMSEEELFDLLENYAS